MLGFECPCLSSGTSAPRLAAVLCISTAFQRLAVQSDWFEDGQKSSVESNSQRKLLSTIFWLEITPFGSASIYKKRAKCYKDAARVSDSIDMLALRAS